MIISPVLKRKEVIVLLLPFLLFVTTPLYFLYIANVHSTLEGKWLIINQGGYVPKGEACVISFDGESISQTECKGGLLNGLSTDYKMKSKYKIGVGRIYFYDQRIVDYSPDMGSMSESTTQTYPFYFRINNNNLVSVSLYFTELMSGINTASGKHNRNSSVSFFQWKRIP